MSDHLDEAAAKVVNAFHDKLSESTKQSITPQELALLTELVKEALSNQSAFIAEELRQLLVKLRGDIDKPEIGL